jgi:hypothetical protein
VSAREDPKWKIEVFWPGHDKEALKIEVPYRGNGSVVRYHRKLKRVRVLESLQFPFRFTCSQPSGIKIGKTCGDKHTVHATALAVFLLYNTSTAHDYTFRNARLPISFGVVLAPGTGTSDHTHWVFVCWPLQGSRLASVIPKALACICAAISRIAWLRRAILVGPHWTTALAPRFLVRRGVRALQVSLVLGVRFDFSEREKETLINSIVGYSD